MADVIKLEKIDVSANNEMILNIFGESEAEVEWQKSAEDSATVFLHTDAYTQFSKPNVLFMFGRRGTGKTAILRMTKYCINKDIYPHYNFRVFRRICG